ncbi:MAG: hypothetical protein QOF33_4837 [Thermomicrobiales bacterium]|nr:hypothetical protein [Thermomicrobiales bacterium]
MALRHVVRVAVLLAIVGVQVFSAAAPPVAAETATPTAPPAQKRLAKMSVLKAGLAWVESQQDESGGFLNPRGEVDPSTTAAVVSLLIALRNVGVEVETDEAVAYLQQTDPTEQEGALGSYAQFSSIVMALVGAGGDPRDVGGVDLVTRLVASWDEEAGIYGSFLLESAIVVMALAVADEPIEERAIETIVAAQIDDGSWEYSGRTEPGSGDAVTTAFIVQTLVAVRRGDDEIIADALAYFRAVQFDGKEFAAYAGSIPDPNTTGAVISALIAAGGNPKAKKWGAPVSGLIEYQNESGGFRTSRDGDPTEDITSTISALTALAGAAMPVLPAT